MTHSRRSILALLSGLLVINTIGCGGGGNDDNSDTDDNNDNNNEDGTVNAGVGALTARAYADASAPGSNDNIAGRVEVRWQAPADVLPSSIINYLIFRDGILIDAAAGQANSYTDRPDSEGTFGYSIPENITIPNPFSGAPIVNVGGSERNLTSIADVERTPLPVGFSHRYAVGIVYRQQNGGSTIYRLSNIASAGGFATPLARPSIHGVPTFGRVGAQSFSTTTINIGTVQGANQYVLEFANNIGFDDKRSTPPFFASGINGSIISAPSVDLNGLFGGNLSTTRVGQRIFFRVGARDSNDVPGPVARDSPNGGEFIYSAGDNNFQVLGLPPQTVDS